MPSISSSMLNWYAFAVCHYGQWTEVANHILPFAQVNFSFVIICVLPTNFPKFVRVVASRFSKPWTTKKTAYHFWHEYKVNFKYACALPNNIQKYIRFEMTEPFNLCLIQNPFSQFHNQAQW